MRVDQKRKNGWNFLSGGIQPFPLVFPCGALVASGDRQAPTEPVGETGVWVNILSGDFRSYSRVGHGVGRDRKQVKNGSEKRCGIGVQIFHKPR